MPRHVPFMPQHAMAEQKQLFQAMLQHALFMLRHVDKYQTDYFWQVR